MNNYVTYLPRTLHLDSEWRVGLSEIHYTNSWFNLKNYNEVKIVRHNDDKIVYEKAAFIDPGRYTDINALIAVIASKYDPQLMTKKPVISANNVTHRLEMIHGAVYPNPGSPGKARKQFHTKYKFDEELAFLLGLENGLQQIDQRRLIEMSNFSPILTEASQVSYDKTLDTDVYEAKKSFDLSAGIRGLYVYSDVADFTVVGNVYAQLLRVVEVPPRSKYGEDVVITYERPHYLPLAAKDVSTIEVDIKDDCGRLIDFRFGRVEVTLHFLRNG